MAVTPDLQAKLVLSYHAKASLDGVCLDLSPRQHDGRVKAAQRCTTWDIKVPFHAMRFIIANLLYLVAPPEVAI